jgi:hypothetical protein
MRVARLSSWAFGFGMIAIALVVPYIGGIVEFTLSVAAVTGGPLLAPPIWALFSRRLTGRATLYITGVSLTVNLFCKLLLPGLMGAGLSRADEMLVGVGLPFLLLVLYEGYAAARGKVSGEFVRMVRERAEAASAGEAVSPEEIEAIRLQNRFGLRMIAFSLGFIAVLLYILSFFTAQGAGLTAAIATLILLVSVIPLAASRRKGLKNNHS